MTDKTKDYLFSFLISENGLAEGKRPPLCDGCAIPIEAVEDESQGVPQYRLNALILDGYRFHSVQCDACIKKYFSKVPLMAADQVPKHIRQGVRQELAQEMEVV